MAPGTQNQELADLREEEVFETIMPGYIGNTNEKWAGMLQGKKFVDQVNFWSPAPIPLLKDIVGYHLFFYAHPGGRKDRFIVGCGLVHEFLKGSVASAWERFQEKNGAPNLRVLIKLINEGHSAYSVASGITEASVIGWHVLNNVMWLGEPLEADEVDIIIRRGTQRGRRLSDDEFERLLGRFDS